MTGTREYSREQIERTRDGFVERMLESTRGLFDIFTIYMGGRLGYYGALAGNGGLTSVELAEKTGTQERYAREWLEQQAVYGVLTVDDHTADEKSRRYHLHPGHAEVLVERDSLNYLAPLAQIAVGATSPLQDVLRAFREGGGVHFHDYGQDVLEGQAGMNRAMFLQELGGSWLPAIEDVHARLQADPPARVADVGCGVGWSSIGIAQSYPNAQVDGFDLDVASIEMAHQNAREAGMNGRLRFEVKDASSPELAGRYDLVTAFEAVHDMSDPVGALRTMRNLAGEKGTVLIMDERVGDSFTPEANGVEWMMYGWSVLHCLPVGMAHSPSAGTGTVMRTGTLRGYAQEAGFSRVEVLPIDNFFFRFYRLHQ